MVRLFDNRAVELTFTFPTFLGEAYSDSTSLTYCGVTARVHVLRTYSSALTSMAFGMAWSDFLGGGTLFWC